MILKSIISLVLGAIFLVACSGNKLMVDASDVQVDLNFVNLDSIIVHSSQSDLMNYNQKFKAEIPEMYAYEIGHCLGLPSLEDTVVGSRLKTFLEDPYILRLEKAIDSSFEDKKAMNANIVNGFKHLKYHFNKGKFPQHIVFMNSLFTSSVFCTENEVGIGLERYLDRNLSVIKELPTDQFFDWIKEGFNAEFIERDVLTAWIMTHYVPEVGGNLAEEIIRWGKILYLTEAAFPKQEQAWVMRYSKEEFKWALENELSFWKYLVAEKLLFKENDRDKANMLGDAPFTIGLPEKGPARLGQYLGWQMVRKYMDKNDIGLEELMDVPYNDIMQQYEI